jgi:hypothetical protein
MKVNKLLLPLIVTLTAIAGSALAQTGETRTEVQKEAKDAEGAGQLPTGDLDRIPAATRKTGAVAAPASGTTRKSVESEAKAAERASQLPLGDLDRVPASTAKKNSGESAPAGLSREQVKSETKGAQQAGQMQVGEEGRTQAEKDPARYTSAPAKAPKLKLHRFESRAATAASQASSVAK